MPADVIRGDIRCLLFSERCPYRLPTTPVDLQGAGFSALAVLYMTIGVRERFGMMRDVVFTVQSRMGVKNFPDVKNLRLDADGMLHAWLAKESFKDCSLWSPRAQQTHSERSRWSR